MRDLWSLFLESFPKILLPGLKMTLPLTAIAFALAMIIAVVVAFWPFFQGRMLLKFTVPKPSLDMLAEIVKYGMPVFLDTTSSRIFSIIMNIALVRLGGEVAVSVFGIIMTILCWFFMYRTRWGYGIRMTGLNQPFVMYSGLNVGLIIILSQVLGGFLAGLGGGIEMLGRYNVYNWKALPGYGWTGITVAILAGNNPIYVPLAALFMSYLTQGCSLMSTNANVPAQMISIIQAVIFLLFAAKQFLAGYRQKLVVQSAKEERAALEKGGNK